MIQIVEQSRKEKRAMYRKCKKNALVEMLINCNDALDVAIKNCNLQSVSQRSELLAFMNFLFENWQPRRHLTADMLVDAYLKANCG